MSLNGIIFDLDGTLTDTLPLCINAFRESLESLAGRSFSDDEITSTFGPSEEGTINALIPEHYEEGLRRYLAAYDRLITDGYGPFPGIVQWLERLKSSGMKLGLVTGKGPGSTKLTLSRFHLANFFDHVATGSPTGPVKKERICELLQLWRLAAREVAYIGDAPSDVIAAQAAGVWMIAATWSPASSFYRQQLESLAPDIVAGTIEEAAAWIEARTAR